MSRLACRSLSTAVIGSTVSCVKSLDAPRKSLYRHSTSVGRGTLASISTTTHQQRGSTVLAQAARTALEEMGTKGEFVRKESDYRQWIKAGSEFPPEGM